jgi:hypothetical protein
MFVPTQAVLVIEATLFSSIRLGDPATVPDGLL